MDIDNHGLEDDLRALEHRLTAWRPSAGALDRDRMLYDAGRAAAGADGRVRAWRIATAALLLVTVGLGGLLVQERSRRQSMETALAARDRAPQRSLPAPVPTSSGTAIEALSPTSYFVLTARLTRDVRDLAPPDPESEPGPRRPAAEPAEPLPHPGQLRPLDVQRILEL